MEDYKMKKTFLEFHRDKYREIGSAKPNSLSLRFKNTGDASLDDEIIGIDSIEDDIYKPGFSHQKSHPYEVGPGNTSKNRDLSDEYGVNLDNDISLSYMHNNKFRKYFDQIKSMFSKQYMPYVAEALDLDLTLEQFLKESHYYNDQYK